MQKIFQLKYWWLLLLLAFVSIVYLVSFFSYRIDLTAEKRFSLSASTKQLLKSIDTPITIKVFLTGDMPSDYKKLSIATKDLLNEFKNIAGNNIKVVFEKPAEGVTDDTAKMIIYDSLAQLGVVFDRTEVVSSSKDKQTNQLITPSALVYYKNYRPLAIDLRSSRKVFKNYNVLNDNPVEDIEATRNAAEALLEFKFASVIDKITRKYIPTVAYCIGNGEPIDLSINDLGENLRNEYRLGVFNLKKSYPDPTAIDALMIVKPTKPFTEEDKLKIDQYVMHGGKVIWFVDKLYAELDSLMRSNADFVAFDRNLNIDDILFQYGVRINGDLLQDLNCSKIPLIYGNNPDGSPKMQRIPWPYYPFLTSPSDNPISKNLDRVLPLFPSSIDTIKTPGISKTILLSTDTNSRTMVTPAMVSLNSVKDENDFRSFSKSFVPVAVLLEGKFKSLFANRLTQNVLDSIQKNSGKAFLASGEKEGKQIVVSDADIVTNAISKTNGPLPMGMIPFENYRFANREFFLNSIDYLVSNNKIFESRNKEFKLRLLDKQKVAEQKTTWQIINIVLPILLILGFGFIMQIIRKKRYAS